jgi:pimeloyl-ACP methyl ester carboxylesterase
MSEATTTAGSPTIVLVHGAFADGSSWSGVIERLQHRGSTVVAPANPLRGVIADSAYLASVVDQIDGPVLLVAHSYGGALITNAATDASNMVGLVEGSHVIMVSQPQAVVDVIVKATRTVGSSDR